MVTLGIKGGQPNWWKILKAFLFAVIIFIAICILFSSCSVEYQDQKALSRVEAKDNLINAAATQWQKNHPPRIDTQKIIIPGKTIYVPVIKTVADLEAIKKAIDSTKASIKIPKCDSAIEAAYLIGYDDALANHPSTERTDTAKYTTEDKRALDAANDTINKLRLQIAGMNGQILQQHDTNIQQAKEITQWKWRFWGSWGGLLFIVIGLSAVKLASKSTPTGAATSILDKIKNIKL